MILNQAHNDWLQWAAEGGLPFVLLFAIFTAFLWKRAVPSIYGMGTVAFLLHALVDYPMQQQAGAGGVVFRRRLRSDPRAAMDYYEELGIGQTASTEEIRQAYRRLARLIHPDHCEARLRPQAEVQMKRLNQILAKLLNPEERTRYDLSLSGEKPVEPPVPRLDLAVVRYRPAAGAGVCVYALGHAPATTHCRRRTSRVGKPCFGEAQVANRSDSKEARPSHGCRCCCPTARSRAGIAC